jgi:hypothetical protein
LAPTHVEFAGITQRRTHRLGEWDLRCSRGRSRLVFVLNLSVRRRPRIIPEQTAIQAFEMIESLMRGLFCLPTIATRQTGQGFIGG